MSDFLNIIINGDGRIPIEVYVCDHKSITTAHQRQEELIDSGVKCFLTTHTQTITHEKGIMPFMYQSLHQRCKALMLNKQVDALVVVIQTDEILHKGFAFDHIDKFTILSDRVLSFQDTREYAMEESSRKLFELLNRVSK